MFPELFRIGSLTIHTYGFLTAIGFLVAIAVIKNLSKRSGLPPQKIVDMAFWCLVLGLVGARVLFIITRFQEFLNAPADMFKIWQGGLVFYGGFIAALIYCVLYLRKHKLGLWKVFDVLTPGLVIAHMFGRFGCLAAGCCYGRPTGGEWGVRLSSDLVEPILRGVPLHPTQLYEATGLFVIFLGLLYEFRRKKFDGQVFLVYAMTYPILRSIVEMYRGDTIRGFVIDGLLSTSQFISIFVFLGALITLLIRLKRVQGRAS